MADKAFYCGMYSAFCYEHAQRPEHPVNESEIRYAKGYAQAYGDEFFSLYRDFFLNHSEQWDLKRMLRQMLRRIEAGQNQFETDNPDVEAIFPRF
jgi:hypothetical protein